jgi:acyl-CoA thioester hydrolase
MNEALIKPAKPIAVTRERFKVWRSLPTRWADNDVYGHVNNVVYYGWFDTAVNAALIDAGLLDLKAAGDVIGLVVHTECDYFAPLSFPQTVDVGLRVDKLGASSVRYELGVFAQGSGSSAAVGRFVHVCVNRADHTSRPWPSAWRTQFEQWSSN